MRIVPRRFNLFHSLLSINLLSMHNFSGYKNLERTNLNATPLLSLLQSMAQMQSACTCERFILYGVLHYYRNDFRGVFFFL
jgi:hypothetical protein